MKKIILSLSAGALAILLMGLIQANAAAPGKDKAPGKNRIMNIERPRAHANISANQTNKPIVKNKASAKNGNRVKRENIMDILANNPSGKTANNSSAVKTIKPAEKKQGKKPSAAGNSPAQKK